MLGIYNLLAAVQSESAGDYERNCTHQSKEYNSRRAEKLNPEYDRRQRTIGNAAEHAHKRQRCRKRRVYADHAAENGAECGADKERRHYLAAFESCAYRHGGENQLEQKSLRLCLAGECLADDVHAGAVVIAATDGEGERYDYAAARKGSYIVLGEEFFHGFFAVVQGHAEKCAEERTDYAEHGHFYAHRCIKYRYVGDVVEQRRISERICDDESAY